MIALRPAEARGRANHGWLESRHTFSFADYFDPEHMGFRALRVLNEDRVQPGRGFGAHPHRDMEIISYVLSGALEHRDSIGNGSIIRHGEVQRMSAGTGVTHSEFNASKTEPVHFLQIWLLPRVRGLEPSYEQKSFAEADTRGRFKLVASPEGEAGSITVHADAQMFVGRFGPGEGAEFVIVPGRSVWLQVARGAVSLDGQGLTAGDGAAVSAEEKLRLQANSWAEVLLFDLV